MWKMFVDGCYSIYYGTHARLIAVYHMIRGHEVKWNSERSPWIGYFGSISCINCPDCEGRSIAFWSRNSQILQIVARWMCKSLGHSKIVHPLSWNGQYDSSGNMIHEEVEDEYECSRCLVRIEEGQRTKGA